MTTFVYPGSSWPLRSWPARAWPLAGDAPPEPEPTLLPDVAWVNGFYALILVANANGTPIGELAAEIDSLTWQLNDFGQARLIVANPGPAARLLEYGNRLLIYLDNGLPPWAGFIDPPRGWRYGSVTLTAYSGERLLAHRLTGRNRAFSLATAGAMMTALLKEQAGPRVVEPGYIDLGGWAFSETYHFEELLDVAQSDLLRAAAEFAVVGVLEAGRIRFRLNLYQRRGRDLANVWLLEGHNAVIEPEEQGPIVNEWLTAGAGSGWDDTGRLYSSARDDDSIARFGLRQGPKVFSDAADQTTLNILTENELALSAEPYVAMSVEAINLPPARFADYDVGDGVGIELYSMMGGYRGTRWLVGREFRPAAGVCRVVLV